MPVELTRRHLLRNAAMASAGAAAAGSLPLTRAFAQGATGARGERKMTKQLSCGAIGVQADQRRAIELAHRFGFESVEARAPELAGLDQAGADALNAELAAKGLVWGSAGLPVEFRKDDERFEADLAQLPERAAGLQRAGVKRIGTWLMPNHDELTYLRNFERHVDRLKKVAGILGDHGLMLGFEYVGTTTLLTGGKFPFIHTFAETRELNEAIGADNVGFVLDSWHWWQAGDTAGDILTLRPSDIALVDLNDAPAGVEKQRQLDGQRELPAATGIIDVEPFLRALLDIGYDGPVRAEPFNQPLRDLDDDAACRATSDALDKAFGLLG